MCAGGVTPCNCDAEWLVECCKQYDTKVHECSIRCGEIVAGPSTMQRIRPTQIKKRLWHLDLGKALFDKFVAGVVGVGLQ
jgi:hypothetical protein